MSRLTIEEAHKWVDAVDGAYVCTCGFVTVDIKAGLRHTGLHLSGRIDDDGNPVKMPWPVRFLDWLDDL